MPPLYRLKRGFYPKYIARRQPFEFRAEHFQPKFFFVIQILVKMVNITPVYVQNSLWFNHPTSEDNIWSGSLMNINEDTFQLNYSIKQSIISKLYTFKHWLSNHTPLIQGLALKTETSLVLALREEDDAVREVVWAGPPAVLDRPASELFHLRYKGILLNWRILPICFRRFYTIKNSASRTA